MSELHESVKSKANNLRALMRKVLERVVSDGGSRGETWLRPDAHIHKGGWKIDGLDVNAPGASKKRDWNKGWGKWGK